MGAYGPGADSTVLFHQRGQWSQAVFSVSRGAVRAAGREEGPAAAGSGPAVPRSSLGCPLSTPCSGPSRPLRAALSGALALAVSWSPSPQEAPEPFWNHGCTWPGRPPPVSQVTGGSGPGSRLTQVHACFWGGSRPSCEPPLPSALHSGPLPAATHSCRTAGRVPRAGTRLRNLLSHLACHGLSLQPAGLTSPVFSRADGREAVTQGREVPGLRGITPDPGGQVHTCERQTGELTRCTPGLREVCSQAPGEHGRPSGGGALGPQVCAPRAVTAAATWARNAVSPQECYLLGKAQECWKQPSPAKYKLQSQHVQRGQPQKRLYGDASEHGHARPPGARDAHRVHALLLWAARAPASVVPSQPARWEGLHGHLGRRAIVLLGPGRGLSVPRSPHEGRH